MNIRILSFVLLFILIVFAAEFVPAQDSTKIDLVRERMVEKMDKLGLRFSHQAIVETPKEVLKISKSVIALKDKFTIAKTAPTIEFCTIPIPNHERCQLNPPPQFHPTLWSSWGQGNFSELTQTYYAAFGNHRFPQARIYIAEYNTNTKTIDLTPEINQVLGRNLNPNDYGDGKIHGWLQFYNGTDLYFITYWAEYPAPADKYFHEGYDGSHIMSYNVITKKFTDYGVPMPRVSWPFDRLDTKRGLLFGVGVNSEFLCYDLKKHKVRFAGFPQDGIMWSNRCMVVDEKTGYVYSSNSSKLDKDIHMIRYNPAANKFKEMKSTVPPEEDNGGIGQIRASTQNRLKDGSIICVTKWDNAGGPGGELFKFFPDKDSVKTLSLCWPGKERYTTSMAISPNEKYLYYLPGAHGVAYTEGCPLSSRIKNKKM